MFLNSTFILRPENSRANYLCATLGTRSNHSLDPGDKNIFFADYNNDISKCLRFEFDDPSNPQIYQNVKIYNSYGLHIGYLAYKKKIYNNKKKNWSKISPLFLIF